MFSYKAFIKSCLSGGKSKKQYSREDYTRISLSNFNSKEVQINSLNFETTEPAPEQFIHSPRVPQLPSMTTPVRLNFTFRPRSIDSSPRTIKESTNRSKFKPKETSKDRSPVEFQTNKMSGLRVSSLNTKYSSNQQYIMENLEKAKKYFPIPLGRKQLKTTSMSISHTPMSRLYSPQNFAKRLKMRKNLVKSPEIKAEDPEIEISGKKTGLKYQARAKKIVKHCDLYDLLIDLTNKLELFKRRFDELDKQNKGYLVLDDFRSNFPKKTSEKIFTLFRKVSNKKQFFINDFLAICAVYLHNNGNIKSFNLNDSDLLSKLEIEIEELKDIFEVHTKGTQIPKFYLQGLTEFLQPSDDVLKAESLVLAYPIDFSNFLRWIPYFLYIHVQLLNKTFQ